MKAKQFPTPWRTDGRSITAANGTTPINDSGYGDMPAATLAKLLRRIVAAVNEKESANE